MTHGRRALFAVSSALLGVLAVGYLFFPDSMLAKWNVTTDGTGLYVGRRYGAMALGYAMILLLARNAGPSDARAAIMGGGTVVSLLLTCFSIWGVVTGTLGPFAWTAVIIEAGLGIGFAWCFIAERKLLPKMEAATH